MKDDSRRVNAAFWLRQFGGLTEENVQNLLDVLEAGEDIAIGKEAKFAAMVAEGVEIYHEHKAYFDKVGKEHQ